MTSLAGSCRCHRHVPSWDLLRGPLRTRPSIPLGRVGKDGGGEAEWGLGDRTTPAADYRAQRSEERHMPLKLFRRARRCFHLQAPHLTSTQQPFDAHFVLVDAGSERFHGDCILLVCPSRAAVKRGRCKRRQQ